VKPKDDFSDAMSVTLDLFANEGVTKLRQERLSPGALVLRGFAIRNDAILLREIQTVIAHAPLRHMQTPGGFRMSVAMTNCGALGWVSDTTGYRYAAEDPDSGLRWPAMPDAFIELAANAASQAGFDAFRPDACLINRYEPGARLTMHQDKNERDFSAPIVSVSLGLPALFLFGGPKRNDKTLRVPLFHGDVVVWGGPSRLRYHGVSRLKEGTHALLGACRINLTFRKAA
jgi:alkylated DNA repair protein (DNA oxidative demethylase)